MFNIWWYRYLFKKRSTYYPRISWITVFVCRIKGHPCGAIYYSFGFEPNNHCKHCGDLI